LFPPLAEGTTIFDPNKSPRLLGYRVKPPGNPANPADAEFEPPSKN